MKIRRLVTLVVGITSVALGPITWAAGHGSGGSGFRGGGGGHSSTGGDSGGGRGGAVGTRGGGVGFGGMRLPGRVPSFEGTGPRFSTFGHPSHVQSRPDNPSASRPIVGARQSDPRFSNLRNHVVSQHDANWHNDWDRRRAHFDHNRFFVFIDGLWCGLDAGYFPWDYLPYYPNDYYPYDYYTDADPYDYNDTSYNVDAADSARVQTVQMQLARLGYYSGSIDGVFGPSTRDAVARYQIANQLNVTGSLSPDTLQSLGLPQATPS